MDKTMEAKIERMRHKLADSRNKYLQQANHVVGDTEIGSALQKAIDEHRRLAGFMHSVAEITGRKIFDAEVRKPLSYYVGREDLKHRLRAIQGMAKPTIH
jgi:hypothetical protein